MDDASAGALSTVLPVLDPAKYSRGSESIWPALQGITDNIWPLLCHKMNCSEQQLTQQKVLTASETALHSIRRVVVDPDEAPSIEAPLDSSDSEEDILKLSDTKGRLMQFAANVQRYAQRVNEEAIKEEVQQVMQGMICVKHVFCLLLSVLSTGSCSCIPEVHVVYHCLVQQANRYKHAVLQCMKGWPQHDHGLCSHQCSAC